jgi:hypothetical protein
LIGNVFSVEEDATPIYPITIFQNDRLYSGVLMYLYCGKKIYTEDTVYINGMRVGRKLIVEYVLNSPYSSKKCKCDYDSVYAVRDNSINVIDSLIHYVTSYFNTYEYSSSNVERLQLDILNDLDERSGTLVSPYVIREVCKLYRII